MRRTTAGHMNSATSSTTRSAASPRATLAAALLGFFVITRFQRE